MLVTVSSAYYYNFSTTLGIFDKVHFRMQVDIVKSMRDELEPPKKSLLSPPINSSSHTHTCTSNLV